MAKIPRLPERLWEGEAVLAEGEAPVRLQFYRAYSLPQVKALLRTSASRVPHLCGADFKQPLDKIPHIILADGETPDAPPKLFGVISFNGFDPSFLMPYGEMPVRIPALMRLISETPALAERYYGLFEGQIGRVFAELDERYTYQKLTPAQLADPSVASVQHLLAPLERLMSYVEAAPSWQARMQDFNYAAIFFCEMVCETYTVGPSKDLAENRPMRRGDTVGHLDLLKRSTHAVFLYLINDKLSAAQVTEQAHNILFDHFDGTGWDLKSIGGYQAFVRDIDRANPDVSAQGCPPLIAWQGAVEDILVARFTPGTDHFVDGLSGKEVADYLKRIAELHGDAKLKAVIAVAHYAKTEGADWKTGERQIFSRSFLLAGIVLPDELRPPLDFGPREERQKSPPPRREGAAVPPRDKKPDGSEPA